MACGVNSDHPAASHLGLSATLANLDDAAELWYQAILEARPDWAGTIALHHGSLEGDVRDWVEDGLRHERLRAVVCTSSLDLGVDFAPRASPGSSSRAIRGNRIRRASCRPHRHCCTRSSPSTIPTTCC
jgi:Lhr-like helicase